MISRTTVESASIYIQLLVFMQDQCIHCSIHGVYHIVDVIFKEKINFAIVRSPLSSLLYTIICKKSSTQSNK